VDADIERVRQERNPLRQGQLATELLALYQTRITELARLRKAAVLAMHTQGMTYAEVAAVLGVSKGRVSQIIAEDRQ
jgi:DNA-directed RNA polymerase specialized sigma24 family protein